MSDWTSVYSTIGPANGGLDLEMPKTKYFAPDKLKEALATGRITEKTIDEKVEHLLSTFIAFGLLDRVQKLDSIPLDYDRSRRTALDVAREGIVLLKNDGDRLPLKGRTLILGPNADTIVSGGGSGSVSPFSVVPAGKALKQLTGKISPSGKLPITYDRTLADNPSYPYYYKNGDPKSRECDHVDYGEGIFTGYRGYDRSGKAPLYPFGYGLSYTTFKFSDLAIEKLPADSVAVSFTVSNTGRRAGAEVAQVYVGDPECSVPRPQKELKGFEKVALKPGESRRVTVVLPPDAFSFRSLDEHRFLVEPGEFKISVGNSSANLPLSGSVNL